MTRENIKPRPIYILSSRLFFSGQIYLCKIHLCILCNRFLKQHLQVARDEDLREQIGKDIFFDLVDHDKVHSFRIQKQMPFNLFKVLLAYAFCLQMK